MFVCQTPHFFAESVGGVGFNEPEVLVFCTCIGCISMRGIVPL